MKLFFKTLFVSICLINMIGCDYSFEKYIYGDNFKTYLKKEFYFDLDDKHFYYLIDLEGCSSCVQKNLDMLEELVSTNSLKDDVFIIFIGSLYIKDLEGKFETIFLNSKCLIDDQGKAFLYELGLSKPLLIKSDSNHYKSWLVSDFEIDKVKSFIKK
ncbi:hypothetical protein KIH41_02210 [Litoribacter ruber]|uniref:hypothetical protein n=1 Tax=Litoribacter ruber TaxID=702568 RepID=UPI001BDA2150|nr:hypothetical protein [Litoribacter ruber]MBT0810093.1 hypothetical protein [Litoribacter ruber]